MSEFREYYKKIPVDIRQSFGSTSKTAEYVYNDLQAKLKEADDKVKELNNTVFGMHVSLSTKNDEIKSLEKIKDAAKLYVFFPIDAEDESTYMMQYNKRKKLYSKLKEALAQHKEGGK